ncbi:MAG TPA: hypothetical protein VNX70_03570 [Bryobacteraceae bacterium]|nr:hypothetical protein [Bryobacteraceae bacterium]
MKENGKMTQLLDFVVVSAIELDEAVRHIAKLERRSGRADESRRSKELIVGAGASRKLSIFYSLLTEMSLCRVVDSFLTYLTELLSLIFASRPETLRSGDQVRLDFVLAHPTRAALIKAIIDRQVNQLSYQGMNELAQFLSNRLGFRLFPTDVALQRAILVIEIRNLIVHARGIANDTFLQRVPKSSISAGSRIKLTIQDIRNHMAFLAQSVADIESRAHNKFGVKLPYKVSVRVGKVGS